MSSTKTKKGRSEPSRKEPSRKKAGKSVGEKKNQSPWRHMPFEITQVVIQPVNKEIDKDTKLLAEASVTLNGVLTISGISIVSTREGKDGDVEVVGVSPPISTNIEDEVFEVIKFIDSARPEESPMWNYFLDKISEAFLCKYTVE